MKFLLIYVPNLRFSFEEDWCTSTIGENFRLSSGLTPSTKEKAYFNNGIIPWINSGELKNKYISFTENKLTLDAVKKHNLTIYPMDTMVIAIYGLEAAGVRGKASITKMDSTISQSCMAFNSLGNVLTQFMYYVYKKEAQILGTRYAQGTKQQNLSSDLLSSYKLLYPSKEEQLKIVNFLSLIDEKIETQSKIIDDYNSLKMGIYNCMFKENYADYKLKQLAYIVKGDQINNDQLLSNGSYYMMNGGASPSGYLDSYNVSENTISISEGGNSCGYVQFNSSPFWSGGHCYTIQNVNSALIENKYLYHYLKYKEKEIMNLRIGTGLPNIQKKDLENFTILVPSLLIQRKNLALFEMLDEKISILNEELANLQKQKKYLLCNMFI